MGNEENKTTAPAFLEKLRSIGITRHNHRDVVYKYMDIQTAIQILTGKTLRFTKPIDFNDPFEAHLDLIDCSFLDEQIPDICQNRFHFSVEAVKDLEYRGEIIRESIEKTFEEFRENIGVTCFSKKPDNALMWAHYGDKHKGVCLGFSIPGYNRGREAFNVNYASIISPIKFFDDEESDLSFWYWIFTKSNVWAYEEEVRLASFGSNGIQSFDGIDVVEVCYGVKTSEQDMRSIEAILPFFPIRKRSKMEIASATFNLVEMEMP